MTEIPEVLKSFAERAGAPGGARVQLEQKGTMRLRPGGRWLAFTATQTNSVRDIEFVWRARVNMAPFVSSIVEDSYRDGAGRLDVRLFGRFPLSQSDGPDIDRGEAQRYFAELPWNPWAIVANPRLQFGPGAGGAHRVWVGDPTAYVDLACDPNGDIVRAYTETRPRDKDGPIPWEGAFSNYGEVGGVRMPRYGEVAWLLPTERFVYWRGEITGFRWS